MRTKRVITDVGIYHIYQQANSRVIIFYDDEERSVFLSCVSKSAQCYGAKVYAYVLMDNHFHLLVKTSDLSGFVSHYMMIFVKWYNRKRRKHGNLCNSPFSSSPKNTMNSIVACISYIINNPVKSGMVKYPADYLWSSANQYFDDRYNTKSYLVIDPGIVRSMFPDKSDFDKFISMPSSELNDFKEERDLAIAVQYSHLTAKLLEILNGRFVYDLSKDELVKLIIQFSAETKASYIQLANLFHVSYTFVRDAVKGRV